jgi:urease accessory protein
MNGKFAMSRKIIGAALFCLPSLVLAHPGHGSGFAAAFAHPFTGLDHLLMMLSVGIFAGRIGGNARWQLPLAFLSAMTVGWIIAAAGYSFAGIESGIAAGLIALGVMFVLQIQLSRWLQAGVIAIFAVMHGMAHGAELSNVTPVATSIGFLAATILLHVIGLGIASLISPKQKVVYFLLGILLSVLGGGLAITA